MTSKERVCRICATKEKEDDMATLEKEEGIVIFICPKCFELVLNLYHDNFIDTIEKLRNWLIKPSKRGEKKEEKTNRDKLDEFWKDKSIEDL